MWNCKKGSALIDPRACLLAHWQTGSVTGVDEAHKNPELQAGSSSGIGAVER
ncbi:MAG: hypothetical protein J07HQW1_02209 [Haloquadratum walsbyi J07HQW1]|uniref:Uncharacterized protein n=1 Tax=Haloquadratum walsbyi J07HQW1 TaxID=1238424 RepID=U1MQ76_9EURY|nr:MAG: hypothetical protein J07HQW1_02209 [Haloquadratum walsbyi J07HQW1]